MLSNERELTFKRLDEHRRRAHAVAFNPECDRIIILGDAHKGDRGEGDSFQRVAPIYCGALNFYAMRSYRLLLLGDVEEGTGAGLERAVSCYSNTYEFEKKFAPDHYLRVYGDSDRDWKKGEVCTTHLENAIGAPVAVHPAVLLGEKIMVVHGHEGDLFADRATGFSGVLMRFLLRAGGLLIFNRASAAGNSRLRCRRAQYLYEWAKRNHLVVIAGHTHLAYFETQSVTLLLHRKIRELEDLLEKEPAAREKSGRLAELTWARKSIQSQDPFWRRGESISDEPRPHYFNAGCCHYRDGITGIEIADGQIALVKWSASGNGDLYRRPFASRPLAKIVAEA